MLQLILQQTGFVEFKEAVSRAMSTFNRQDIGENHNMDSPALILCMKVKTG